MGYISPVEGLFGQKMDFLLPGLLVKGMMGFDADFRASTKRTKSPKTYFALRRKEDGTLGEENDGGGDCLERSCQGRDFGEPKGIYLEASLNYQQRFADKHDLSALFLYMQKETQYQQEEGLLRLPYRKQSLVSRISYAYDDRYIVEASMGATGSEILRRIIAGGIFPAVGIAWYISHEKFMQGVENSLTKLKLRTSYGIAGNDNVFSQNGGLVRFPYRGQVTTDGPGYDLGLTPGAGGGVSIGSVGCTNGALPVRILVGKRNGS